MQHFFQCILEILENIVDVENFSGRCYSPGNGDLF